MMYSSTLLLVGLGIVRTVVLSILGYPYEVQYSSALGCLLGRTDAYLYHFQVSEYGIHWNFFYTLAVVNVSFAPMLLPS